MKNFFKSASGMDARGVGPRIMLLTLPFILVAVVCEVFDPSFARIGFASGYFLSLAGWFWMGTGLTAFIITMAQFIINFPKGELITTGMYAFSRNPIYSSWTVFVLPGLGLILSNWLFFLSALAMGLATVILVKEEERQLSECFGQQYTDYKKRVGCMITIPW
jgi:protein-S-isoprenylcysteine O-methyltransferase Ste14